MVTYLVYPAQHLNFARCTIYIRSYMSSRRLRRLNKPLVSPYMSSKFQWDRIVQTSPTLKHGQY